MGVNWGEIAYILQNSKPNPFCPKCLENSREESMLPADQKLATECIEKGITNEQRDWFCSYCGHHQYTNK